MRVEQHAFAVDLPAALQALASRGITRLLVEGGSKVASNVVRADLVDEAALFTAPRVIGPGGIDALDGLPLSALTQSRSLVARAIETLGEDKLEIFERP